MTACRTGHGDATDGNRKGGWRSPDIRSKIGMVVIDARIDNGNHVGGGACRDIPCRSGAYVGSRYACHALNGLSCILQSPQLSELGIIRGEVSVDYVVRLHI